MATVIRPDDFAFLKDLVLREAAIVLDSGKEYLATSRLEPVARQAGLEGIGGLVTALRSRSNKSLVAAVVDAMTTNETLWFRDAHPFETIEHHILPELLESKRSTRTLDIWCAAASTGQEPYSLAMLLSEIPILANWRVNILATDISASALDRSKAGSYSQMEMGRGLPAKYMVKYFTRSGVNWEISANVRSMVNFRMLNLAGNWPVMGPFDLVMIRNVLIYFSAEMKTQIINRIQRVLRPEGYLMLGSTESLMNTPSDFARTQHNKTTFYKFTRT